MIEPLFRFPQWHIMSCDSLQKVCGRSKLRPSASKMRFSSLSEYHIEFMDSCIEITLSYDSDGVNLANLGRVWRLFCLEQPNDPLSRFLQSILESLRPLGRSLISAKKR
jgi:hypothetical protein